MIQIFAGFDQREAVGYHAFVQSIIENASEPVSITALHLPGLSKVYKGGQRDGTNAFIYSRFLVPHLMGHQGGAIFVDGSDMLCTGDIAELWALYDPYAAVQVVQHHYKTRHPVKYVGTAMESVNQDYPRKNWSSVMLINCAHYDWRKITPETVESAEGAYLHRFAFIENRFIGSLPPEWNWLIDEYGANENAKLLHWTCGMPGFAAYRDAMGAREWQRVHARANFAFDTQSSLSG